MRSLQKARLKPRKKRRSGGDKPSKFEEYAKQSTRNIEAAELAARNANQSVSLQIHPLPAALQIPIVLQTMMLKNQKRITIQLLQRIKTAAVRAA